VANNVDLKIVGFDDFARLLEEGPFRERLKKEVERAMAANCLLADAAITAAINSGTGFKANRPLTVRIKGSSRPLVDGGDLVNSINYKVINWKEARIGVLRSKKVKKEGGGTEDLASVAKIVHDGATIKVTQKMRWFFMRMWRENPERWKPLHPNTKVIVIPPRRFLEAAVSDKLVPQMKLNWEAAIWRALHGEK
jgi:hypothetical protein